MDKKNDIVAMVIIALKLTAICFVAVLLLGLVNLVTAPKIAENAAKSEKKANQQLMPDGTEFLPKKFSAVSEEEAGLYYYFEVLNSQKELLGYIVASTGSGYGGKMKVMVALDPDLQVLNAKLMNNDETPGLGKKAEKDKYMEKFKNTNTPEKPFPATKNMLSQKDKDSITGATITFNGVTGAITKALELMKGQLN